MNQKTAVVTGASQGLGRHIAIKLSRNGYHVILVSRQEKLLSGVCTEIEVSDGSAEFFVCDVTDVMSVRRVMNRIIDNHAIDVLVNNAGVYYEDPVEETTGEKLQLMFETNALGTIKVTQAILPQMKKRNKGQILNVISIAGIEPSGEWGLYASSKFAVTGFTESLRKELIGTNIKVMAIYPEGIDTNIFRNAGYQEEPNQKWMMKPEDVAEVVVFMLTRPGDVNLSQVVVRKIE